MGLLPVWPALPTPAAPAPIPRAAARASGGRALPPSCTMRLTHLPQPAGVAPGAQAAAGVPAPSRAAGLGTSKAKLLMVVTPPFELDLSDYDLRQGANQGRAFLAPNV